MTCTKCGAPMLPGAGFCGSCGHRIDGQAATPPSQQPPASFGNAQGIHIDHDSRGQGRVDIYEAVHHPSLSRTVVSLQAEQSIQAEAGAMVSMSANVELQSQMKGGL